MKQLDENVSATLTSEMNAAMLEACQEDGIERSEFVRRAIAIYLLFRKMKENLLMGRWLF